MKIITTQQSGIKSILRQLRTKRSNSEEIKQTVQKIIEEVKKNGDRALFSFSERFDGVSLKSLIVTEDEIQEAWKKADQELINALKQAKKNIAKFHSQIITKKEKMVETEKGVQVWREFRPIEKVGLYIPGGKAAYPSTVLMLGIPAKIAGCREIVLCAPPAKDGKINSSVLTAAKLCGITQIYKAGGAQAIAAMAYGTETIPKVSKIFGPGNQYVTTAKMLVYGEVDIDMPAGPSELAIIADDQANPAWIAADLLSQLEHGEDSQAVLLTFSKKFAEAVIQEMEKQKEKLNRRKIIEKSWQNSLAIIVKSIDEACEITNEYAPEHLEIVAKKEAEIFKKINNAGSIFLGKYTSEPLGDYATGANHTLPTSGFAKMFSPLSAQSFGKMMQVQKVSKLGIKNLRKTVEVLAKQEGLEAHGKAVRIRRL